MKSPRFDARAPELKAIFHPNNLEKAWKKVHSSMRKQHLLDAIDNLDFHLNRKLSCQNLSIRILSGDYIPSVSQRILSEKSKGLCRQIVIPHPEDALVLQCLSDALYAKIKGKEPTEKAFFEPEDHTFSKIPTHHEYGTFFSWLNYQKELFKFSQTRNFIVITDIANYYDSISYSHLRNIIASTVEVQESVLDMMTYVLGALLWQPDYMPRIEVGLPQIDLDAPRLLAHCFLYELDSYLAQAGHNDFVRFMDDIDVGVDTIAEAKAVLRDMDLVLQSRQVRLNSGKTLILTKSDAEDHFKIMDNAFIDALKDDIKLSIDSGLSIDNQVKTIRGRISSGLRNGWFDRGNGDKILKRLIGLSGEHGISIRVDLLKKILHLRPSVRESVYRYISRFPMKITHVSILHELIASEILVDEVSYTEIFNVMVETSFSKSKKIAKTVDDIITSVSGRGYFGLHAAIWGMSKFSSNPDLLNALRKYRNIWVGDVRFGRLIGGLAGRFWDTPEENEYFSMIANSRNTGARDSYAFHRRLKQSPNVVGDIMATFSVANSSRATGITHAKFLCLLSAVRNPALTAAQKAKIAQTYSVTWTDAFYRSLAVSAGVQPLP